MTIELTPEDLTEALEKAHQYGACILKMKTTDGDDIWVAVQNKKRARAPRTANSAEQQNAATNVTQQ